MSVAMPAISSSRPREIRANFPAVKQNDPAKPPIRYGITPMAFLGLGWLIAITAALLAMAAFRLVSRFF